MITKIQQSSSPTISIVLVCPEIPQNTGNIGRLCMATNAELVLVRPLGFRLTDTQLKRAGMDYWERLSPIILNDVDECLEWLESKVWYCLSAHGTRTYADVSFHPGNALVFGSESGGLPEILAEKAIKGDRMLTLPMIEGARCLNLSSSAAAVTYEAMRQIHKWGKKKP